MIKPICTALLCLSGVSIQAAKLPSMCFDGTYAGGGECDIVINGEKVDAGLVPDDFFKSEEELAAELGGIVEGLFDQAKK